MFHMYMPCPGDYSPSLTYSSKLDLWQFSGEELKELRDGGAWENPAFDNMDQLMDER